MITKEAAAQAIEKFCSFTIEESTGVLKEFASLPNAIAHLDCGKRNFVYVPGTRKDRVVLVAHADTVWDAHYVNLLSYDQELAFKDGEYYGRKNDFGFGADDRAGCAMLWLLRDSGHSLLVVDGEEHGQIGSHHIQDNYPEIFEELNNHAYMIQLDRRGNSDYKFYRLPVSHEFRSFIEENTGYHDAGKSARTDIVTLCKKICGVNLSIGYYDEHTPYERLVFEEWYHTLALVYTLLQKEQKQYLLDIN